MWSEIIYKNHDSYGQELRTEAGNDPAYITDLVARGLYSDVRRLNDLSAFSDGFIEDFESLSPSAKAFWTDFAGQIPAKFRELNLFIRPFKGFCRTCIITDNEINDLVQSDLKRFTGTEIPLKKGKRKKSNQEKSVSSASLSSVQNAWDRGRFFLELNYLVPAQLKRAGFEIIRKEEAAEITMPLIRKIARAIHSKYIHELRSQNDHGKFNVHPSISGYGEPGEIPDFDKLPEEIKFSNIDNAAQIPAKLLSIGYRIRYVKKGFKPVTLHLTQAEIETMSIVEHIRWSWDKRLNGWTYGDIRDDIRKTHPGLVPYSDLPEQEKEKDRELVKLIPSLLNDLKFEAFPVDVRKIRHLSYALKPQSAVHKILNETRELNEQIRKLVTLEPSIDEMVRARNNKIELAIREVEESYNYAKHIQDTFLPDDLYIRELFPESFVLYKPKDIVSGDFYFFSRHEHLIIFAVADCTGHGIPGALLTTIGYGILDQAVNEKKLFNPPDILSHLYSRIHRFLGNIPGENGVPDDMDIILCLFDTYTNNLKYAGVKNPLYHISDGLMTEHKAQNTPGISNTAGELQFASEDIRLKPGDTIYLCSDGYADQFGGKSHKKYLSARLKSLLMGVQKYSMPEQEDRLYEEIEQWREENHEDQTDDILVIGIKI
jgi:serine phosphatase RsbU (regulator of sigma subunit)